MISLNITTWQDTTPLINKGVDAFERISNPILIILLVVLLIAIVFMYIFFTSLTKEYKATIVEKDKEIQSLNKVLQEVRTSDMAVIVELKNTLNKFSDADKEYAFKLDSISTTIQQLLMKIDLWIKVYNK